MDVLALFRGCSRLEYRNQTIKLLRATDGEVTRTAYRLTWVSEDALALLASEKNPMCIAVLVDAAGEQALPLRQMIVDRYEIDEASGILRLRLVIDAFLDADSALPTSLASWPGEQTSRPPAAFVSTWGSGWPEWKSSEPEGAQKAWRQAIDFLTANWDLDQTTFFRLQTPTIAEDVGPRLEIAQGADTTIRITCYNPHLDGETLQSRRLSVQQSGGLASIGHPSSLDRDGDIEVRVVAFEAGQLDLELGVQPDPQYSTYIPLRVDVVAGTELSAGAVRVLGRQWRVFLDGLAAELRAAPDMHLSVLELLARVFPEDPLVHLELGRALYLRDRLAESRTHFDRALQLREDATTVAWSLFAALRRADVEAARGLLGRLNLSHHELFDGLLDVLAQVDERTGLALVDEILKVFGHDKAMRALLKIGEITSTARGARAIAGALRDLDGGAAFAFLLERLHAHPDWGVLRHSLLDLASDLGRRDVGDHALRSLTWDGSEAAEALWGRYLASQHLLHPSRRAEVALSNAEDMLTEGGAAASPGRRFALEAGALALSRGRLLEAEHVLALCAGGGTAQETIAIERFREHLASAMDVLAPVQIRGEEYREQMIARLRPQMAGRSLVVFGGTTAHHDLEIWERTLHLQRLLWLTSSVSNPADASRITALEPGLLVVVFIIDYMPHVKENVIGWLKRNNVPTIHVQGWGEWSVLEGLDGYFSPVPEGP